MKLRTLIVVGAVALTAFAPQMRAGDQDKKAASTAPGQSEEIIPLEISGMT